MTLPHDIARCAGRADFAGDDTAWCPERDSCQRYLALTVWDREAGQEDYQDIHVMMAPTITADGCPERIVATRSET